MTEIHSNKSHGQGRQCVITRRAGFSASHLYRLPELSDDENHSLFGPCAKSPGHGHNYELIVSLAGELNADGMLHNLSDVKSCIRTEVTEQLDFAFLNEAWPEFDLSQSTGCLPTTEYLVQVIWRRLSPYLPIVALRLYEHPRLWADHFGDAMETSITIRTHFSAAHRLARQELTQSENEAIYGKCARPSGHGHNYFLDVTVQGSIDSRTGMVCDLSTLQCLVEDLVVERFDHTFLNEDIAHFKTCVPTAENIALYISDILIEPIEKIGAKLQKVRLQESPNNAAEVYAEPSVSNLITTSVNQSDAASIKH